MPLTYARKALLKIRGLYTLDIGSEQPYPAQELSNFHPHAFTFDGVQCASMEGLLQSFKYPDPEQQRHICQLTGRKAKRKGSKRNKQWKQAQILHWNGESYLRGSRAYQHLLDDAFAALSENPEFRRALRATGRRRLTHHIGSSNPANTVLTEKEFVTRLVALRKALRVRPALSLNVREPKYEMAVPSPEYRGIFQLQDSGIQALIDNYGSARRNGVPTPAADPQPTRTMPL